MSELDRFDVVIVGGGPGGLAAAERTVGAGLSTCVIDEQQRPGGQILRQPPAAFRVARWMDGRLYRSARELVRRSEANSALHWLGGTSAVGLERRDGLFRVTVTGAGMRVLEAPRVLVAAGCYDMPVALPGWTLPGVMSAGGLQTLLKSQQVAPGQRVVLFGSHPLQIVLAEQLLAAGVEVAAVCFPQSFRHMIVSTLPHLWRSLATPGPLLAAARGFAALRQRGVDLCFGTAAVGVEPADGGTSVGGLRVREAGAERVIPCDLAVMCYGFLPQSDLPRQAGAQVRWSCPAGGWETSHDHWMRASLPGLYVAGETTGVAGADAAMAEGGLAGLGMARDSGAITPAFARSEARPLRRQRKRLQGFIALLRAAADPVRWLPWADPETLLCRCEDITAAEVDAAIAEARALGPRFGASVTKLRCRAGMGLCQGRSCEHALVRRIAAAGDCDLGEVEGFRARFPARPVAITDMLGD